MKILIIEDDPASMVLANGILSGEGHETLLSQSVEDAYSQLKRNPFINMILCDIFLPGANGYDLIKFVKKTPRLSNIPIFMCSSLNDKDAIIKSLKLGAKDYIVKPLDASVLISKIRKLAQKQKSVKVLVVDDQIYILDVLSRTLAIEGYEVLMAESAEEAISIFDQFEISAVITDIAMPGTDGLGLTAIIKDKNPAVPVILITGHHDKYKKSIMLKAGADGFIKKPFKNVEIIEQLKKFSIWGQRSAAQ